MKRSDYMIWHIQLHHFPKFRINTTVYSDRFDAIYGIKIMMEFRS